MKSLSKSTCRELVQKNPEILTVFILRIKNSSVYYRENKKRDCSVMEESPCEKVPSPCLCFINSLTTFQRPSRHEFVTFCQTHKLLRKKWYIQLCASFSSSVTQALFAMIHFKWRAEILAYDQPSAKKLLFIMYVKRQEIVIKIVSWCLFEVSYANGEMCLYAHFHGTRNSMQTAGYTLFIILHILAGVWTITDLNFAEM